MATSSNMISALGAGSGIDIKSLAQGLVDAEKQPQKERIDTKIAQSEARISGYSALKFALSEFRSAVEKLNDASDFGAPKVVNSQPSALGVVASGGAQAGAYNLEVLQLARAQRSVSMGLPADAGGGGGATLNGGSAFSLSLSIDGGTARPIAVAAGRDTPQGVVNAINAAGLGLNAQLVRTGDATLPFSIVVTGSEGQGKNFSLTSSVGGLRFGSPTTSISGRLASDAAVLNGGNAFSLNLSVNGGAPTAVQVPAGEDTPQGVANAINAANLGLVAELVDTGSPSQPKAIAIRSNDPLVRSFSVDSAVAGLSFRGALVDAADARLKINGLAVTRPGNTVTDLIPDATVNLLATTQGEARVDLSQDKAAVKQSMQALVKAYNDFDLSLQILTDPKSEVEDLGGSLAGDSLVRSIRSQVRGMIMANSSTPGGDIKAARDIGLSFDRNGKLTLDEVRLDRALDKNYEQVVRMMSADSSNKSLFSTAPAGLAGDLVVSLDRLTRSTGQIARQSESATRDVARYKDQLRNLESRMSKLMDRYIQQFSIMESVVGSSKELRSGLTSSFAGMAEAYKN